MSYIENFFPAKFFSKKIAVKRKLHGILLGKGQVGKKFNLFKMFRAVKLVRNIMIDTKYILTYLPQVEQDILHGRARNYLTLYIHSQPTNSQWVAEYMVAVGF